MVFIGCTGSGKSSLCTALTGQDLQASSFAVGSGLASVTQGCTASEYRWLGEPRQSLFRCIDTPGLDDSEGDDSLHINKIITAMRNQEYVTAIVLVVAQPRFSKSLQDVIQEFENAFCRQQEEQEAAAAPLLRLDTKLGAEAVCSPDGVCTPDPQHGCSAVNKVAPETCDNGYDQFYSNVIICFQKWKMNPDAQNWVAFVLRKTGIVLGDQLYNSCSRSTHAV